MLSLPKLFALFFDCFSTFQEPWHTFADSTVTVESSPVAGGVELKLDMHLHFLGVAVLGACLQQAASEF